MDITRKLASVRKIISVEPIPNADNIVCATVDGWELVTQKSNNFKPGDLVVYFEIDSFLPLTEKFEFLRKSSYRAMGDRGGFRLKTIKLRGQISQGLLLPLSEIATSDGSGKWYRTPYNSDMIVEVLEGDDLTEELGVVKWDPPLHGSLAGLARGNFPSFIPKTDQERVQNCFRKIDRTAIYEVTMKLDGSSMTVYKHEGRIGVCSRNLDLEETEGNLFWKTARKSGLIDALEKMEHDSIAIQGELMGPTVQGNRERLGDLQMYVFDIFDIRNQHYMGYSERLEWFYHIKDLGATIEHVPILEAMNLLDFNSVKDFLDYADMPSMKHEIAEGVVFKRVDENFSFKAINNRFLMKEKD